MRPLLAPKPSVTLKPPTPPVASKASRETLPPLNPSLARVSAGVTSAMIGGGCLLLLLLAWRRPRQALSTKTKEMTTNTGRLPE
jgi:hypothetical protein